MKIKQLYIFLVLFFLVLPAFGQKISKEKKLQIILEKIDEAANKVKTFSATFKQTDLDPVFDEFEESYGNFVFQKTKDKRSKEIIFKVRFDYKKPDKSTTIIDGSKIIIYTIAIPLFT